MTKRFEDLIPRQIDETWEMNMHLNPIDKETKETLTLHKKILVENIDEFVSYINLNEKARRQGIKEKIHQDKLNDFVNATDPIEEDSASRKKSRGKSSIRMRNTKSKTFGISESRSCGSDNSMTPSE